MRNYNTNRTQNIQNGNFITLQTFPIFFLVEWIVGGKVLHTGTTVGVFEVQPRLVWQTAAVECLAYSEGWREMQWKLVKCHRVVRRRVSSVPLVACSPAESVCPPCPEHAPPPLSELFPWQWCRGGRTWWSSLLLGKSVVDGGEKRKHLFFFYFVPCVLKLKTVTCSDLSAWFSYFDPVLIEPYTIFFIGSAGVQVLFDLLACKLLRHLYIFHNPKICDYTT